jgi:hypothetical protein
MTTIERLDKLTDKLHLQEEGIRTGSGKYCYKLIKKLNIQIDKLNLKIDNSITLQKDYESFYGVEWENIF